MTFNDMVKKQRSLNKSLGDTDIISMSVSERNELSGLMDKIIYLCEDMGWRDIDSRIQTMYRYAKEIMEEISYYNGTHEEDYGY